MQSKCVGLCQVYTLFQKKKLTSKKKKKFYNKKKKKKKKQLNFSNSIFCSMRKTEQLFIFSFHLSFPKVLSKSALLSIVKVPYKSALLSIITFCLLLLTYHTQIYFIKAFSYLAKNWLCVI